MNNDNRGNIDLKTGTLLGLRLGVTELKLEVLTDIVIWHKRCLDSGQRALVATVSTVRSCPRLLVQYLSLFRVSC